jgi:hypothetical protein
MKKVYKLILIISLLFIGINASAQYGSPLRFGVKAGLNLNSASMDIKNVAIKNLKIGYDVGLTAEYQMSDLFYLQSGAYFTTKGAVLKSEKASSDIKNWKNSVNLQYVQVPLLASFKLEMVTDTKLFVNMGPYFAYGIGGKTIVKNDYTDADTPSTKDEYNSFDDSYFKKFDFGLMYGAGIEFEKFVYGIQFEFGLLNIAEKSNGLNPQINTKGFKNKGVSFNIGYKF